MIDEIKCSKCECTIMKCFIGIDEIVKMAKLEFHCLNCGNRMITDITKEWFTDVR
jgi:predicted RNA-binding Zn-ribbon protein involved in translation (DUF1610 family)